MAKNLRKGSKVFLNLGKGGLKRTPGVVTSKYDDEYISVRVTEGFAKGKILSRSSKELRRRK